MNFLDKIIRKLDSKADEKWLAERPRIEWEKIVSQIEPYVESHTIFLQSRTNGMILLSHGRESSFDLNIIGIAVAYLHEGIEPWDREVPAKHMAEKLSNICSHEVGLAINRDPDSFIGYYVQINT